MSRTLVFDIETCAFPFESFDQPRQDYLLRFAKTEAEMDDVKQQMNLWGFTAQLITIGLWDVERQAGKVLYQHPEGELWRSENPAVEYIPVTETEMLQRFWHGVCQYQQFVTFNGRSFDYPFLLHRSAMLDVVTDRRFVHEYLKTRYNSKPHCDLFDQFSFHSAFKRKFSLDFFCKAFGIDSPKSHGITGLDVPKLFLEGRYTDIARYCMDDVLATWQLFERWKRTIDPSR